MAGVGHVQNYEEGAEVDGLTSTKRISVRDVMASAPVFQRRDARVRMVNR